jgi:hypothetical protein
VRRIALSLSRTDAKSAKDDHDGPCENDAGTARISFESFGEFVSENTCGLEIDP